VGGFAHARMPPSTGVRRAAAASFGPGVVANFEHRVRDVVNEVLDDALVDEFDWANEVAKFVPSRVIASPRAGVRRERHVAQYEDAGTRMLVIAQA
jgi:cytochrome P450